MSDLIIAVIIAFVLVGTFTVSFAIDFVDDFDGDPEIAVDWPKTIVGTALLVAAGIMAAVRWPV